MHPSLIQYAFAVITCPRRVFAMYFQYYYTSLEFLSTNPGKKYLPSILMVVLDSVYQKYHQAR